VMGEAPESHQNRIERETRRGERKEAETRQKKLEEKYGTATDVVTDPDGRHGMGKTYEVKGADCPDCEGVIRVVPQHDSYPAWKEVCTGDCDR